MLYFQSHLRGIETELSSVVFLLINASNRTLEELKHGSKKPAKEFFETSNRTLEELKLKNIGNPDPEFPA